MSTLKDRRVLLVAGCVAAVWIGGVVAHYIFGVDTHSAYISRPGVSGSGFGPLLFVAVLAYFVPVLVAYARRMKNLAGLFVLDLLLGWTFVGWVAALIWSLSGDALPSQKRSPLA